MDAFIIKGLVDIDVSKVKPALSGVSKQVNSTAASFQKFGKNLSSFGSSMAKVGKNLTTWVTLPIAGIGVASVMAYSDLNEALSKSQQVFDETADVVKDWSKTLVNSHGIAQGQALATASTYGAMGKSMGLEKGNVDLYATSLTELASDMSSFHNTRIDIAQTALDSIYTGETESLKQFGIVMTEANLEQFAMNKGIKTSYREMTQAEKVQLRYAYVMENSKDVMGDFERTNGGLANKMRILTARVKETAEKLGKKLEPIFGRMIDKAIDFTDSIGNLSEEQLDSILKFAAMAAALGPLLLVVGKLISGIGWLVKTFGWLATVVSKAGGLSAVLGIAFTALTGPVGIAIAIIAGLIATLVLLYKKSEKFRKTLQDTFGKLKEFLNQVKETCKWVWDQIGDEVMIAWNFIYDILKNVWNMIVTFFDTQFKIIGDILSFWTSFMKGDWEGCWNAIKQLVKDILTGIKDWYKNILDLMLKMVGSNYEEFKAKTKELIEKIIIFFQELPGKIAAKFEEMKTSVSNKIEEMKTNISQKIQETIDNIVTWFETLPYRIGLKIGDIIKFFYALGVGIWNWINIDLPLIMQRIIDWFAQLPARIQTWLIETINRIVQWGFDMKAQATQKVQETIEEITTWFSELPGRVKAWLNETVNKVTQWGSDMKSEATTNVNSFIDNIVNPLKELPSKMFNIGIDIARGVWDGIKSMGGELLGNVIGFFKDIVLGVQDSLGIHSPSRVFRDEIGKYMAQGVGVGFENEERNVNFKIQKSLSNTVKFQKDNIPDKPDNKPKPIYTTVNFNGPINDPIENARKMDNLMRDFAYNL